MNSSFSVAPSMFSSLLRQSSRSSLRRSRFQIVNPLNSKPPLHSPSSSHSIFVRHVRLQNSLPYPNPSHHSSTPPPSLRSFISSFIRIGAGAYVFQLYIANFTVAIGPSMLPTLNNFGDILFTESITPRLQCLRKGDIVVAMKPTNPKLSILKRIHATAGDVVETDSSTTPIIVPPNHVWLRGDNPKQSTDSRHYGPVPMSLIRSKAWCRIWPPRQICWFSSDDHVAQ